MEVREVLNWSQHAIILLLFIIVYFNRDAGRVGRVMPITDVCAGAAGISGNRT